jgi:hypothetical protein
MLSVRLIKKLEGIEKCSKNGHKARNLFQILTNGPELWMQAYAQIYPNKGAFGVVLFQRTLVLLNFYVLSLLIVKVSHRGDRRRDAV